jgi:hypothetical protein
MSCINFEQLLDRYGPQLFFVQECSSDYRREIIKIYFSRCLKGLVVSLVEMFSNIWHHLRILVNMKNRAVKVEKLFSCCTDTFGWNKIDVCIWGFENDAEFVQFLINYFEDAESYVIIESSGIKRDRGSKREGVLYLVTVSNQRQRRFAASIAPKTTLSSSKSNKSKDGGHFQQQQPIMQRNSSCWNRNPNSTLPPRLPTPATPHPQPQSRSTTQQPQWNRSQYEPPKSGGVNHFPTLSEVQQASNVKKSNNANNQSSKSKSWNRLF